MRQRHIAGVDLNLLPTAALGRIEVLKDGAAATYGSDAVAGVVNFITRTDQEGFRASASYRFVQNTDGDVDVSLSYGHVGDHFRFLSAVGFNKRGQLLAKDRDFDASFHSHCLRKIILPHLLMHFRGSIDLPR